MFYCILIDEGRQLITANAINEISCLFFIPYLHGSVREAKHLFVFCSTIHNSFISYFTSQMAGMCIAAVVVIRLPRCDVVVP